MKNISTLLASLAFIGVVVLFIMHFSDKGNGKASNSHPSSSQAVTGRLAYVNIDTLEAHYEYLKSRKAEFQQKQDNMRAELQRSEQEMQKDIANYQRKAQAGTLTQAEGEAAERRIIQMQQSLKTREASLTEQLITEQEDFNTDLHKRLDSFLTQYNKDKNYDYILSYSRSGSIMYANKDLDITQDVIDGMNALHEKDDKSPGKTK